MKPFRKEFALSEATVDQLSNICGEVLKKTGTDSKDILRLRLSLEDLLLAWHKKLGESKVECSLKKSFGKWRLEFLARGPQINIENDELRDQLLIYRTLLPLSALAFSSFYRDGVNVLALVLPRKHLLGNFTQLIIALFSSIVFWLICQYLPPTAQKNILFLSNSLFDAFIGVLQAVSIPFIFFIICGSIIDIGNISVFKKIGGKVILYMLIGLTACSAFSVTVFYLFTSPGGNTIHSTDSFSDIVKLIIDILPHDVLSPFLNGNVLQIICMAIATGITMLILGDIVDNIKKLFFQSINILEYMLNFILKFMPLLVFLSIFNLLNSSMNYSFTSIIKILVLAIPASYLIFAIHLFSVAIRFKVSPLILFKKILPEHLIGLTTASSTTALSTTINTCEQKLGIPKNIASFAIPLGIVVYAPSTVISFAAVLLTLAESTGVTITFNWLFLTFVSIPLCAIAVPPIAGGATVIYSILFTTLGLPLELISIAITFVSIFDFIEAAIQISCLEMTVVFGTNHSGLLDVEKLRANDL